MTTTAIPVATGGIGTRAVSSRYPVTEGITAGTTKQRTESPSLEPETKAIMMEGNRSL